MSVDRRHRRMVKAEKGRDERRLARLRAERARLERRLAACDEAIEAAARACDEWDARLDDGEES